MCEDYPRAMYTVRSWWGATHRELPEVLFASVLEELDDADDEHPDVALQHASAWCLSCFRDGRVIFENVEDGGARHLVAVSRARMLELWKLLARGDLVALDTQGWSAGYPP